MADEVDDFLNANSGSVPSFKFKNVGDKAVGVVTRRSVVETKKIGSDEKEKSLVLELLLGADHTQDVIVDKLTGRTEPRTSREWSVWVKVGAQLTALTQALKDGGAPKGSPATGDQLAVKFTGTEPSKTQGFSPKKLWEWQWKAGATVNSASELLGD